MGCSSADCSSAGSTLTHPDILQYNFTILHSNEVGFFAFKREQNYLQNDTKCIVICFVLSEIFYFKQKINTISVTAPSYLTYLFINCDHMYFIFIHKKVPQVFSMRPILPITWHEIARLVPGQKLSAQFPMHFNATDDAPFSCICTASVDLPLLTHCRNKTGMEICYQKNWF